MRSTGFVFFSIIIHALCFAAIALTPIRTISPERDGQRLEVDMGPPADQAGAPDLPIAGVQEKAVVQAPSEIATTPPPPPEKERQSPPAKPVKVATAPVRQQKTPRARPQKVKPQPVESNSAAVAAPLPSESSEPNEPSSSSSSQAPEPTAATKEVEVEKTSEPQPPQEAPAPTKFATPNETKAKEVAPLADLESTKGDEETEAKSRDAQKTSDPVEVAGASGGEMAKGGASMEGAVSYLDLKQMPGNKSPQYPLQARVEKRQGQLELIYRVNMEGSVSDIQLVKSSGSKDLDNEAIRAIALFRFVPGQEGWARHPVSFALKGPTAAGPSRLRSQHKGNQAQAD